MRNRYWVIGTCLIVFFVACIAIFFRRHDIPYLACYRLSVKHTEFYPDAYRFIHSEEEFGNLMQLVDSELDVDSLISQNQLDFARYTYLIVFGARIKRIYYSYKSTWFNDRSPSYAKARRRNKNCVFVEYDLPDHRVYLYRLERDTTWRGFDGI